MCIHYANKNIIIITITQCTGMSQEIFSRICLQDESDGVMNYYYHYC